MDSREELNEIREEIAAVKGHSETWSLLQAQAEQANKERFRQWILILTLIVMLVVSNMAWLYAWLQYDYGVTEITAEQDGSGVNIVGGSEASYGAESQDSQENENQEGRLTRNTDADTVQRNDNTDKSGAEETAMIEYLLQEEIDLINAKAAFTADQKKVFDLLVVGALNDKGIIEYLHLDRHKYYKLKKQVMSKISRIVQAF